MPTLKRRPKKPETPIPVTGRALRSRTALAKVDLDSKSDARKRDRDEAKKSRETIAGTRPKLGLPRHRGTTAHTCSLYPWSVHSALGAGNGVYLGVDKLSGDASFIYDTFEYLRMFGASEIALTNPNIMILGLPGFGKSTLIKSFLYRQNAVYGTDRFLAIVDVKSEYGALAEALGLDIIRLEPGGATRVNPLEVAPGRNVQLERSKMVGALLATVLNRPLSAMEKLGLWEALAELDDDATLVDLVSLLIQPTKNMAVVARRTVEQFTEEIRPISLAAEQLVNRSLKGMFDGPSTVAVTSNGPGVVIDISAVLNDKEALPLVMTAATAWLSNLMMRSNTGRQSIQVLDEVWRIMGYEAPTAYLQECWKLGRSYGIANIAILHKPADLGAQTNDGSATGKIAQGLVEDSALRITFRQSRKSLDKYGTLLGFGEQEKERITRLRKGESLWKIGNHGVHLKHDFRKGSLEAQICDTDSAMRAEID